jgi:hypothetical protein
MEVATAGRREATRNVATSRAKCLSILVCSPALFEPEWRTPEQVRMANAFCRYLELAAELEERQF